MYIGTFVRDSLKEEADGFKYWISKNENGEDFYELRNAKNERYVVITNPDNDVVCGIDEEGRFSFHKPYKVYFVDDIPNYVELDRFTYDGNSFEKFINVEVWKYNMNLEIKEEMMESFMLGEPRPDLVEKRKVVEAYIGDGKNPPLPFKSKYMQ